jgi:hypothetical protein
MTTTDLGEKFEDFETDQYRFRVEPVVKREIGNSSQYFHVDNYNDTANLEEELDKLGFGCDNIEEDISYMISIESKSEEELEYRELEICREEGSILEVIETMRENQDILQDIMEKKEETVNLAHQREINESKGGLTIYDEDNPKGYIKAEEGSFVDLNRKI